MGHDVKSIRKKFRERGVFYTDPELAQMLKSYLPDDITEVYDPTCGSGSLLSVFPDNVRKYGQEIDPEQAEEARKNLVNAEIATGDTLTYPAFINRRFKAISANYPFSVKWDPEANKDNPIFEGAPCLPPPSKADYAFILHIIHCLADDGVAAVLGFPGILYRGQREGEIRKWLIERNLIDRVVLIEGDHFVDTKTSTALLVFRKNRQKRTVTMRDNLLNLEREVSLEEIAKQGYNLSVNSYVENPAEVRVWRDPVEMEAEAQAIALKRIRAEISFSILAAETEAIVFGGQPRDINPFLDKIQDIVNEFRRNPKIMEI